MTQHWVTGSRHTAQDILMNIISQSIEMHDTFHTYIGSYLFLLATWSDAPSSSHSLDLYRWLLEA
jgi:hypothetical protein